MSSEQANKTSGSDWRVAFQGELFRLTQKLVTTPDGKQLTFERSERPPGSRTIVVSKDGHKILLSREWRDELGGYDYRLPGGKTFNTYQEYRDFLDDDGNITDAAERGAGTEVAQEAGIKITKCDFYKKALAGGTVVWELYYFVATDWEQTADGQQLEHGEEITTDWYPIPEVARMALSGEMHEDRSTGILLQWLYQLGALSINQ